jgi:Carboxypeptidase regulatory-like domain
MISVRVILRNCWEVRIKSAAQVLGGIFLVLLLCVPAFSQGSYGRILGTITDQTGGVVSGATVTVIDTERGITRTLMTDDAGAYNAPNLTPGNYTIRADAKGFKRIERQGVVLEVGHDLRVDLTVQPGEQSQTVTVTEAVPLVETTNATQGGTLENAQIVDLPLNGRDYQNLLSLRPGVQLYPGGGPWTQSANNTRPDESVWMVDGVINFNPFDARPLMNMPGPFQDSATILPIDAIQEFNLMENPRAEYGWKSGAIVNVGVKAGTNALHGDAYAFGRTTSWDARNYFNVAPTNGVCLPNGATAASSPSLFAACNQVDVSVKQFGGVVGGPIKKDKLFFFGGYEGFRDHIGSNYSLVVPATGSVGDPAKGMVDAINALQTKGIPLSTVSLNTACPNAIGQVMPLPTSFVCNGGGTGGASGGGGLFPNVPGSNSFLSTFPIDSHSDNGIGKLEWHVNDKNTVSGIFWYSKYNALGQDHGFVNQNFTDFTPITAWTTTASWVYTPNSQWVNEARFSYNQVAFDFVNSDISNFANGTGIYSYINTGAPTGGFPSVGISGFAPLGTNPNRPQFNDGNPYWHIQDSLSYLRGKNSFKFGGEFTHSEADSAILTSGRGSFGFNGNRAFTGSSALEDFFAGTPNSGLVLTGNAFIQTKWKTLNLFVQDDWRVTPKLIVNVGLRWGLSTPMRATDNLMGNFDPSLGMVQQGFNGLSSGGSWNTYYHGFDPRVGFAYDLTGKGTTVIRAGLGIVHTVTWPLLTWNGQFGLQNNGSTSLAAVPTGAVFQCGSVGTLVNTCPSGGGGSITLGSASIAPGAMCWDSSVTSGPAFTTACAGGQKTILPVATTPQCGDGIGGNASPCDIMGVNPNLANPYVVTYTLGITHQIGENLSIEIAYVGNHGYSLLSFTDANQTALGAGWCLNTLTPAQKADACKGGAPASQAAALAAGYNPHAAQEARPFYTKFPYLGFINFANNGGHSNYNSLQATITKRTSHGLSFVAGYTYAHALDNGSINRFGPLPQNSNNLEGDYGSSDFDIRHRLTLTGTYNIPGIKGFAQMLEGWELNAIYSYSTAQPWQVWDGSPNGTPGQGDNISGTGEGADRWNIAGNPLDFPAERFSIPFCSGFDGTLNPAQTSASCVITNPYGTPQNLSGTALTNATAGCVKNAQSGATLGAFGCYASANGNSFLTPPPLGNFGNMGRNILRDYGFNNLDFSIFKNFTLKERYGFQFRWEVFNVLNHPIPANPYGSSSFVNSGNTLQGGGPLGFAGVTNDFAAGNPLIGSGSQRVMQLGLKISF